jgi:hypothetical protein
MISRVVPSACGCGKLLLDEIGGIHADEIGRLHPAAAIAASSRSKRHRVLGPDIGLEPQRLRRDR